MNFKLLEYNVVSNVDERNEFCIQMIDDYVLYNGEKITDNDKISRIKNVFTNYRAEIVKINNEPTSNYKGGRQQILNIQFEEGKVLYVIGNTPSTEMASLYSKIKNQLINIIED